MELPDMFCGKHRDRLRQDEPGHGLQEMPQVYCEKGRQVGKQEYSLLISGRTQDYQNNNSSFSGQIVIQPAPPEAEVPLKIDLPAAMFTAKVLVQIQCKSGTGDIF